MTTSRYYNKLDFLKIAKAKQYSAKISNIDPKKSASISVEDAGGGMAFLMVNDKLPKSVADRVLAILADEALRQRTDHDFTIV